MNEFQYYIYTNVNWYIYLMIQVYLDLLELQDNQAITDLNAYPRFYSRFVRKILCT